MEPLIKKVGKRIHGPGDFLVVEDKDQTSTWHLPVREHGKPIRELAVQAWAALFSAGGYRGSQYEGPDKSGAETKLHALYKTENWDVPNVVELGEMHFYIPYNAKSFADLDAAYEAQELGEANLTLAEQFKELVSNIFYDSDVVNKQLAVAALTEEFIARIKNPPESASQDSGDEEGTYPIETKVPALPNLFAESGSAVQLLESDGSDALIMEVVVIEPGHGNKDDGHYYTADLLKEFAPVFTGVKMYATDHKASEKSERTEVSEILECPVRFTKTGAPVARVGVYDPVFAKKVRNRDKLGTLANLQCSILASGTATPGNIAGQAVKIVESIDVAHSVDWVTKAGAGGRALNLMQEAEMDPKEKQEQELQEELEEKGEPKIPVKVVIKEADPKPEPETPPAETTPPVEVAPKAVPVLGIALAEIAQRIGETSLPPKSIAKLVVENYGDAAALDAAIDTEIAELREAGSGRPFALTESVASEPVTVAEADARKDAVNAKWGFTRSPSAGDK